MTAAFTLGSITKRFGVSTVMFIAVAALCPALVAYAVAPRLWLSAVTLMLIGLCYGYAFTSFASTTQQSAPDEMRGTCSSRSTSSCSA